jgi:hypothetical protein
LRRLATSIQSDLSDDLRRIYRRSVKTHALDQTSKTRF